MAMHPAILWKPRASQHVQCMLCSHYCLLAEGQSGRCRVRINKQGTLYTLVADTVAALHIDPIEKKPLYHFLPGTTTLSLGTPGCNLRCVFCQNHQLSQHTAKQHGTHGTVVSARALVQHALATKSRSISYTYSEPTIFSELVLETAALGTEYGLKNILVSNGFQSPQCLAAHKNVIHAANFDLKSFSDGFYHSMCGARLKPVLHTLKTARKFGWWIEITTLIIPGYNDSKQELDAIARFIASDLGVEVPWHVSRFHPQYQLSHIPPTPASTIERALESGKEAGLLFVYPGNIPGHKAENTYCPRCSESFIPRTGFTSTYNGSGLCTHCAARIPGIWK